jgi:hypothetical protein
LTLSDSIIASPINPVNMENGVRCLLSKYSPKIQGYQTTFKGGPQKRQFGNKRQGSRRKVQGTREAAELFGNFAHGNKRPDKENRFQVAGHRRQVASDK